MNTRYFVWMVSWVWLLIASCSPKEKISVTYFKQQQAYDSVRFSDGSYAVYCLQYAPQNSLTAFYDNKGRTIATIARATECYAQTLVYDYDEQGRLIHLLCYKGEIFDGLEADSCQYGRTKEGYLGFRQMLADMDYAHPDTAKYEQSTIEYDREGDAVKVYVEAGKDSIVAPEGYKLEVAVKPCLAFWDSDINGGAYIFHVTMEPKRQGVSAYKVRWFADYMPTMEADYQNGRFVKTVWYDEPSKFDDKDLIFCPVRMGDLNVYTTTWKEGGKRQRAYRNGKLAYVQEVSKYGTVMKREDYAYLSDNKIRITLEKIDYGTRKLSKQSVRVIDVPDRNMFQEELNLISGNDRWENYYHK